MTTSSSTNQFGSLLGGTPSMREVFSMVRKAAKVDVPVLIAGETGTGKDLIAKELHDRSSRASGPFVAVNMGVLQSELVGSELFGHRKGAFTGATEDKAGRFLEANGGTLFLDEIATMDEGTQVALLRVLETGAFRPIGGKRDQRTDIRLIAATNSNLRDASLEGGFRQDLLHRLEVVRIEVPPLRERVDDIVILAFHFLKQFCREFGYAESEIEPGVLDVLRAYDWPGNVRELRNVIAQAAVMADRGVIAMENLPQRLIRGSDSDKKHAQAEKPPEAIRLASDESNAVSDSGMFIPFGQPLDDVQKAYVTKTLERCGNNKTRAAKALGMSRKTLYDRLKRWGRR